MTTLIVAVASCTFGLFVGLAARPSRPSHPTIVPGCRYVLQDRTLVQVTALYRALDRVDYGPTDGVSHARQIWTSPICNFAASATLYVQPGPPPAPEGSVSMADA